MSTDEQDIPALHYMHVIGNASYQLFGGAPNGSWKKHVLDTPSGMCAMAIGLKDPVNQGNAIMAAIREPDGTRVVELHALGTACETEQCYSRVLVDTWDYAWPRVTTTIFGERNLVCVIPKDNLLAELKNIAEMLYSIAWHGGNYDITTIAREPSSNDFGLRQFLESGHRFRHSAAQDYIATVAKTLGLS